jgi:membrane protein DedA with SNARE-associated domain
MHIFNFGYIIAQIETLNTWVLSLITSFGYVGLGFVMFLENIFPPIPSEIILPLAGSLIAKGDFSLAGYWFDEKRVRFIIRKYGKWFLLSTEDLDRALSWFQRYGCWVVFFGRMIPMVRSLISIPAGMAKMSLAKFTLFTALGTACWSFLLSLTGLILRENWILVEEYLARYDTIIWILISVGILVFMFKKLNPMHWFVKENL